ncbi:MFS transporter [Georgenia subflava]|uniref:MFS transporter n=1 Tax=Georgenia subflava TaxID=1622177 RepID=UPI002AAF5ED6|nr:MFS transporter [Georgenia subflava]
MTARREADADHRGGREGSVLGHRDFRRLWLSNLSNEAGARFSLLAVSVTAVSVLGASPFEVAVLTALADGAYLLLGIPVGVWVDRWRKKPVLVTADVVRAAAVLSVPLAHLAGALTIYQLMAVVAIVSAAGVFFDTAHTAVLPALVGRSRVSEANARLQTTDSMMRAVAPGAAGLLLTRVAAPVLFLFTAAVSAASAALVASMKVDEPRRGREERDPFWPAVTTGLRFVVGHPALRTLMVSNAANNLGAGMLIAIFPVFVLRDLGVSPAELGVANAIGAGGAIVGSLVGLPIKSRLGEVRTLLVTQHVRPLAFLVLPLATVTPIAPVVMVALNSFAVAFVLVVGSISSTGMRARVTPHHLMGRVSAASRFVTLGTVPIGALAAGALGTWIPHTTVLVVAAATASLAAVAMLLSPLRALRNLPQRWEDEAERAELNETVNR